MAETKGAIQAKKTHQGRDGEWKPCCQRFDPSTVKEDEEIKFDKKPFVKDYTYSVMHMPINFPGAVERCMVKMGEVDAIPDYEKKGFFSLTDHSSPFRTDIYVASTKDEVPGAKMELMTATFMCKAFEGPYKECGSFSVKMKEHIKAKTGNEPINMYYHYTTCPKCVEHYGENHVVLYAQVA
jgi:hypothetical protein